MAKIRHPAFLSASFATLAVLVLWLTRPDHSLWLAFGLTPTGEFQGLPYTGSLLSLLIVPLCYFTVIVFRAGANRSYVLSVLLLTSLVAETSQLFSHSLTFDVNDCLAIVAGAAISLVLDCRTTLQVGVKPHLLCLAFIPLNWACYPDSGTCYERDSYECDEVTWISTEEIRADIIPEYDIAKSLLRPGKIITIDNDLLVVDRYTGIHIYDVSDIQNPLQKIYIPLPGVTDISSDGVNLYANAFRDYVVIPVAPLYAQTFSADMVTRAEDYISFSYTRLIPFYIELSRSDEELVKDDYYGSYGIIIGAKDVSTGEEWLYGEQIDDGL